MLNQISTICKRFPPNARKFSTEIPAVALQYEKFGEPCEVLKLTERNLQKAPQGKEVVVKVLLAPINPADINTIQGKYPVKPPFPAIGGNDCLAEVIGVGRNAERLKVGDLVIPNKTGLGTWTTFLNRPESDFRKVTSNIDPIALCQINVNPPSAYRMLKDFVTLEPGDTVIQNGSNSSVGRSVLLFCKTWGLKCIAVVRDRPDITEMVSMLKCIGATEVLTEDQSSSTDNFKTGEWVRPKLALNCVGGTSALNLSRHLADGGVMVTYGGMSKKPITIPTASLIFRDIRYKGFWMTRWTEEHFDSPIREEMFNDILKLMEKDFVPPPYTVVDLKNYKDAMHATLSSEGFVGKKMILKFND